MRQAEKLDFSKIIGYVRSIRRIGTQSMAVGRGVFAVDRGVFDHPMFKREPLCEIAAWIWLLREAQWEDKRVRVGNSVIPLKRGQLAHSRRHLAREWQWDESKVRRFLLKLKKEAAIRPSYDFETTVITICNYDDYQFGRPTDDPPPDPEPTQQRPSSDPKQRTKIIEEPNNNSSMGGENEKPPASGSLTLVPQTQVSPSRPSTQRKRGARDLTPVPEGFGLTTAMRQDAVARGVPVDEVDREFRKFLDWHTAKGSVFKDWMAAWRTWCGNWRPAPRGANGAAAPAKGAHGYSPIVEMALQAAQRTREP